jgi:hypothetical protein
MEVQDIQRIIFQSRATLHALGEDGLSSMLSRSLVLAITYSGDPAAEHVREAGFWSTASWPTTGSWRLQRIQNLVFIN